MHADDDKKTEFEKIVTNEPLLFAHRLIITGASFYLAFIGTKLLHANEDLKDALQQYKYEMVVQIASINGKAEVLNSRVDALSNRMTNSDNRLDGLNARLIEMLRGAH